MVEPTEDVPYNAPDFVTPDKDNEQDEDQPNKSVLLDVLQYCEKAILEHNTFDVLSLPQNATPEDKCAVFDEMFNHKGVVMHLRNIKNMIEDKVEELK